ncbi:MAG: hypothetical protein CMF52_07300 [Legionellales bacterium]|nr:hypothetical protein [Legionellales bacterium]
MKIKHNKKRNTAFVYEALVREGTSAILQGDEKRRNTVISLIKKHFANDSILKKDLECYRSLYEANSLSEANCAKIIKESRLQKRLIDPEGLFIKQSDLIHDVNKELSPQIFNNFVPNYKSLASIYQMFSNDTSPKDSVLLENSVLSHMQSREQSSEIAEVDDIVVNSFVQKFNTKYDEQLLDEQKTVLNLYIKSFVDNSVEFKMYLNEEIKRLKDEVNKAKHNNLIKSDSDMLSKTEKIIEKLDSFKNTQIDEHVLSTVLKVQSLVKETVENGNSN